MGFLSSRNILNCAFSFVFICSVCVLTLFPASSVGRSLRKRSPQLSLTVVDDDDESTTERRHPPSIEDLEERRKALVKALLPGGDGAPNVGGGLMTLTELGVDLVGGTLMNTGEVFAPLRNATAKARENFPRIGDVINRVVDSARDYRKKTGGALRTQLSSSVNNGIRIFTTVSSRGGEVLGGFLKVFRAIFDNFTLAIQNLAQTFSRTLSTFTELKSKFLTRNFQRAQNVLSNGRLFKPAKIAAEVGSNLVQGFAQDLTQVQPWVSEGVKSKLTLGASLVPRLNLATILAPSNDESSGSDGISDSDDAVEIGGGYNKKRDSEDKEETTSGESKTEMKLDEIPADIMELLESANSKSETKTSPKKSDSDKSSNETSLSQSKNESKEAEVVKSTTSEESKKAVVRTSRSSTETKPKSAGDLKGSLSSLEDLFGLST